MYSNVPFLDNKETVGAMVSNPTIGFIPMSGNQATDDSPKTSDNRKSRTRYNRQRCRRMARAVKQNRINNEQLHAYLREKKVADDILFFLIACNYSAYGPQCS